MKKIFNLAVAGPACSGKSSVMFKLLKTIEEDINIEIITDSGTKLNFNNYVLQDKAPLIALAINKTTNLIAIDQVNTPAEALQVFKALKNGKKVWFTTHWNGLLNPVSRFRNKEALAHFVNLLKMAGVMQSAIESMALKEIKIILTLTSRSGEPPPAQGRRRFTERW